MLPTHSTVSHLPLPDGPAFRLKAQPASPFRMSAAWAFALALLAGSHAHAGDILRGGAPAGQRGKQSAQGGVNPAAELARQNAKDTLARTSRAMQWVKGMQDSARTAALAGPNNLGQNPNRPGQRLIDVPNGLGKGGLQVAAGVPRNLSSPQEGENSSLWRGATLPKQAKVDGRVVVTIDQLKPQAVLNWETFNVGKKTTLTFNQNRGGEDKSQWTAFNKIKDPSGAPSQILGKIEAPGQVYVINPNGIIFGGSSQINLHTLVASSLPINDGLITRGLLNNPDAQFLFSALPIPGGAKGTPAFTPEPSNAPGGKYGNVEVREGAQISSPTTSAKVGGRVMLVGPNVKNAGTIETPDGQTILAAGLQVGVSAHPSSDARLRGLDVYVGAVTVPAPASENTPPVAPPQNPAGHVVNTGIIEVPRANATLAGKDVEQLGVINSSTSVTLNGSINLQASYGAMTVKPSTGDPFFAYTGTGNLTLGPDSVTQILPELFDEKKVVGTELALRSKILMEGRNIHLAANSTVFAPSADVTMNAGAWLNLSGTRVFTYSTGQIYVDAGALINVAGTPDVSVEIAQNILSLELRGAELADSPLQRKGPLRGPTLNLDVRQRGVYNGREWVGTPLGDASGYAGLIERSVGELTTSGGNITMNAGGSVVVQSGAKLDVSGGYVNFQGGMVKTTRVISDGRVVDIANATPDRPFSGIYDGTYSTFSPKYGIAQKWANPLAMSGEHFEPTYIDGRNGGTISISAPGMALDGEMVGRSIAGPRQRTAVAAPKLASLSLAFEKQDGNMEAFPKYSPTAPAIVFGTGAQDAAAAFATNPSGDARPLSVDRLARVILSPELFTKFGFGSITLTNPEGSFTVPEETELNAPARGSLTVTAANVDIQGKVRAPGGKLSLTAYNFTPYLEHEFPPPSVKTTPLPAEGRGNIRLGAGALLSTTGLMVDDRDVALAPLSQPMAIDGGSISIEGFSVALEKGSVLDVSGGVAFAKDGKRTFGSGGSLSIKAGNDPKTVQIVGGALKLDATLLGYSGGKGGALTVQAPSIQVGGTQGATANTLLLDPSFFSKGGFSSFSLIGLGEKIAGSNVEFVPGVVIAEGTQIHPEVESWRAVPNGPNGTGGQLTPLLQPEALRSPVSLSFSAPGVRDEYNNNSLVIRGDVVLGEGARIHTPPGGTVSLSGETVTVLGEVIAPGGSISVSGSRNLGVAFNDTTASLTSVHLGANSLLSAKGTVVYTPNPFGQRTGYVLPGGKISVSGNIVAEAGAVLDVSGVSGVLDMAPAYVTPAADVTLSSLIPANSGVNAPLYSRTVVPTRVDSDAGEIVLSGGQHLFSEATLLGNAGGPSALGGTLTVSSGRYYDPTDSTPSNPLDITLQVTQDGPILSGQLVKVKGSAVGQAVRGADGSVLQGFGRFAVNSFERGGFDSLNLKGTVEFVGPVSINARRTLSVADGGVIYANDATILKAPYVVLGTPFLPPQEAEQVREPFLDGRGEPFHFKPTHGRGSLTVIGDLIDIGNLSLQNIGQANFIAEGGDIRGDGTLNVAGNILMKAAQVYPPTAVTFTIAAFDYKIGEETLPGSVTIVGAGTRQLPLSAGGQLNVYGSVIEQSGTLRAPLGGINLGWDGTGAAPKNAISDEAVAVTKLITLGAGSLTSVSAVSPDGGSALTIPYGLNVNGVTWIDPMGRDITAGGVTQKSVNIAGESVNSVRGSRIDLQGGGDLYAYRWVQGIGGMKDILASTTSFAVIPGYGSNYAPYAPFNPAPLTPGLNGDPGYTNSTLRVGDRVHLTGGGGLAEGDYTLLPARYALMPGAFLVTLKSGAPIGTLALPDGSTMVPGYRFNNLNQSRALNPHMAWFEVLSQEAVRDRSEYGDYFGNEFLFVGARANETQVPRLPGDAGHLTLQATKAMILDGQVTARGSGKHRGGLVDIASPTDIVITANGGQQAGKLVLSAAQLSSFGAESLLIGGIRNENGRVASVSVKTNNLTVNNAGSALKGAEIILVANQALTLADGAQIIQEGKLGGRASTLLIGSATVAGSGNGTLLRVTSDASAQVVRSGLSASTVPNMVIGEGVLLSGFSLTLDSTYGTSLAQTATLDAFAIALNSGQISIQLDNPGDLNPTAGLVLGGGALQSLSSSKSLSLLSYSSIDIYGTGKFAVQGSLAMHAGQIRGFNNGGGTAEISAASLRLDNSANAGLLAGSAPATGTLVLSGDTVGIGKNQMSIERFDTVQIDAARGIVGRGSGGLTIQNDFVANTPVITAARSATQSIIAGGDLTLNAVGTAGVTGGLGASLTLQGQRVLASSDITLASGLLTMRATTGDVEVAGRVSLTGWEQTFYDQVRYTSGGQARLISDNGSVILGAESSINVSAQAGGGDAGALLISAKNGAFVSDGEFVGKTGAGGHGGSFSLDAGSLPSFAGIQADLTAGGFNHAQSFRVRTGNVVVDTLVEASDFRLSTDQGSITISNRIDASGHTGGNIYLAAGGNLTLASGAVLDASGETFNSAGKGGAIFLETRGINGGSVSIQSGATIDLGVDSQTANSAAYGHFSGTLHVRAPQINNSTDVAVGAIGGQILGASSIIVEGYKIYTPAGGNIANAQADIQSNGVAFLGAAGSKSAGYDAMLARILGGQTSLGSVLSLRAGAEIVSSGNLVLGSSSSTYANDWNLATYRYGVKNAPGVLTLRAGGNITLFNTISDGFESAAWDSKLLTQNGALPVNAQSWIYRFTAGADLDAADFSRIIPASSPDTGSLILGKDAGSGVYITPGSNQGSQAATTYNAIINSRAYQVIRTGSGDITISTGRDVQFRNQFASIFTVGTQVANANVLPGGGSFDVPNPITSGDGVGTNLGPAQRLTTYPAQYTLAGGNVTITAENDITHVRRVGSNLVADSVRQMPTNWLYRRGNVGEDGQFASALPSGGVEGIDSTTWWVDFSNFFEGVGALGGGNVTLTAGRDVANVDASIATNARMASGVPDAATFVELGGGDLVVRAGRDIDAGVYYVERGHGTLNAGGSIKTNSTRSATLGALKTPADVGPEETWLPTTLFLGKGSFDVSARGNVLMGPVANPFLLPGGYGNSYRYKSYFSTYGADSGVNITSLGGDVTLRLATVPRSTAAANTLPILQTWYEKMMQYGPIPSSFSAANYQPWLLLNETDVSKFGSAFSLMPGTLRVNAFAGDINVIGQATLSPSPSGTVELIASGAINGLNVNGSNLIDGVRTSLWGTGGINLSDAPPSAIPSVINPLGFLSTVSGGQNLVFTGTDMFKTFDMLFAETGSTQAVLEAKQALHAPGLLHSGDHEPVRIYAGSGDISSLTIFSPKPTRIFAGRDISDVALYLQNLEETDASVVAAGRDIVAYNANTPRRVQAVSPGNLLNLSAIPLAGDIQIAGPGTLEVLAGRNIDLGSGANNPDGTGLGIVSIGNARNPFLPFGGADLIVGAGIGPSTGLDGSALDFTTFLSTYLNGEAGARYLQELATLMGPDGGAGDIESLSADQQKRVALNLFYLLLRDAGRDHNDPTSKGFENYNGGFEAIAALFPGTEWKGDISLTSREIKTKSGGSVSIFAPGGKIVVGFDVGAKQALDQGILTESGGDIRIFSRDSVTLGTSRIFTLRGGNEIIWSSLGDIAAGTSSKTVQSAPPTRVLIDPQSADLKTDLAGLATGGGIGVLATVEGVKPGDVDLVAPNGAIDAGDAGIRVSGNLNISATKVLNAENIQVTGTSAGAATTVSVSTPTISVTPPPPPTSSQGDPSQAAQQAQSQQSQQQSQAEEAASIFTIEILGYGGGDGTASL